MKGTMKSCSRYDITYLSLDTRYHTGVNSHITAQNRASLMLILELLFITEGVLNCPFWQQTTLIRWLILYAFLVANKL